LKKVLIVEDDLIIALSTEKMVQRLGFDEVKMVTTGEDAVQSAIDDHPDVILMDIRLAGEMDGIDAIMEIRKHVDDVKVIFITGNADPVYKEKAEKSGFEAYLIKPVRFDDLKKIIA